MPLRAAAASLKTEAIQAAKHMASAQRCAGELLPLVQHLGAAVERQHDGVRRKEDVEKELEEATRKLKSLQTTQEDEASVVLDVMNTAKIQALTEDNRQLKAENDRLKASALKLNVAAGGYSSCVFFLCDLGARWVAGLCSTQPW